MYAVYHGPGRPARHRPAASAARRCGWRPRFAPRASRLRAETVFDTLKVLARHGGPGGASSTAARARGINLRAYADGDCGIALDETVSDADLDDLVQAFSADRGFARRPGRRDDPRAAPPPRSPILTHPVFHAHRSETEMLRYLKRLESRDLSLTTSMIPLGSCTMKLNAAAEMFPISCRRLRRRAPVRPEGSGRPGTPS